MKKERAPFEPNFPAVPSKTLGLMSKAVLDPPNQPG